MPKSRLKARSKAIRKGSTTWVGLLFQVGGCGGQIASTTSQAITGACMTGLFFAMFWPMFWAISYPLGFRTPGPIQCMDIVPSWLAVGILNPPSL